MTATIKQKLAFQEVVKGSTLTDAMSVAGYSDSTSKRTNKLTRTKGWSELMEEHLPDSSLAKRHRQLLNKNDKDETPDVQAVSKALDMAYRLKGYYEDKETGNKTLVINLTGDSANRYGINIHSNTKPSSN